MPEPTTPVVTLFESYGAGAGYIGPRLAQALGLPFHQQAFSSSEIEDAMVKHESQGLLSQVFGAMGGSHAGLDGHSVAIAQQDNHALIMDNTRTVLEAAQAGGVITGRNGALILAAWPGALHVLLDAPLERRVERAASEAGIAVDPVLRLGSARTDALRPGGQHRNPGPRHVRGDHRRGRPDQGGARGRYGAMTAGGMGTGLPDAADS
jgi:hypothetical protein